MERVRSCEVSGHVGRRIRVAGWLHAVRRMGGITFVVIRDGWGVVQAVASDAPAVQLESIVEVTGVVVAQPQLELHEVDITVLEAVTEPPPVSLGKKQLDLPLAPMIERAVIANRHPTRRAVFALAAAAMRGFRAALDRDGFTEIQTPKLVGSATEGGANVFAVKYFERTAYLAQSPQLYKQIMVGVFERVFEVGPVFRAEPHDTARHLSQYTSLDVEMAFIGSHVDVMAQLVRVLRGMFEACEAEVAMPETIPVVHFSETGTTEPDLSPEDERRLGARAKAEHGSDFVFVTGYPMSKRPFYTHPDPGRPAYSNSFDLLFRGTELVTGGQRLHRHADYVAALAARGMSAEPLASYLDAFRFGMPPHGGFAIGLERFVMQLLGLPNIRLATLFPRDLTRLDP